MAAITLFGVPQSSYVWSARMTLRENGIAYGLPQISGPALKLEFGAG